MNPLCAGLISSLLLGGCPKPPSEMPYAEAKQLHNQIVNHCRRITRGTELHRCIEHETQRIEYTRRQNRQDSQELVGNLGRLGADMMAADAIQRQNNRPSTTHCTQTNWGTVTCQSF